MFFEIKNFEIDYKTQEPLVRIWATRTGVGFDEIDQFVVLREAIDARKKNRLKRVFHIAVSFHSNRILKGSEPWIPPVFDPEPEIHSPSERPIVIGAGPAGLFAAMTLAERGYAPVLLEQGQRIPARDLDVMHLKSGEGFNERSNILFGEGGAGTYSDGKLTARNRSPYTGFFFDRLVRLGAPPPITWQAKPHLGTDRLKSLIPALTLELEKTGVTLEFGTKVLSLEEKKGQGWIVHTSRGDFFSDCVILAPGHSADPLFRNLFESGIRMEKKTFAVGLRIEHPRRFIDISQYGAETDFSLTGSADYKLTHEVEPGRGVYSFCVCPGGEIVNASSEPGRIAVNGMSSSSRNGDFTNGAIVTTILPADLPEHPLAGLSFREAIEKKAAREGLSAPCQKAADFLCGRTYDGAVSTYLPSCYSADLNFILPESVVRNLKIGLYKFDNKIRNFISNGILVGPETGTSSPVRILRDPETFQCLGKTGLFPVGEGAGYSGGIVSSAADGIRLGMKFRKR